MQGFSHRLQNQYSSTPQRGKWETVWRFRDGSDSRPLQPRYPHHSGAFHQHALHDEAGAWEKVEPLAREVRRLLLPYRKHIKTITTDNGSEFAAHKMITKYLGTIVYFADPYASWQKGTIENTNKLIRQYMPKKANFDDFTDKKIANIQKKINRRPRQKLNFKTPKCEFYRKI